MKRTILDSEIKKRKLTYTKFAEKLNVSKGTVSHIVNCRHNPSWKLQKRLVEFFGIPAEQLLAITDENPT